MSKELLDSIFQQLLELEGLVLLLKERKDDAASDIKVLLANKSAQLLENVNSLGQLDSVCDANKFPNGDLPQASITNSDETHNFQVADDSLGTIIFNSDNDDQDLPLEQLRPEFQIELDSDEGECYDDDNIPLESSDEHSIHGSSGLASIFTINDKYRFRRELFGNNSSDFTDALNLISAMNSFNEAKEYITDDLNWDVNSEEVADFMAIIESYFKLRK